MKTILIADDSPMIRKIAGEVLCRHGFTVLEAENGKVAQEILEQHVVDLVLTDNEMPVMTGFELIRFLRHSERFQYIPIVMMSGQWHVEQEAIAIGATAFVTKPFNNSKLAALITHILSPED